MMHPVFAVICFLFCIYLYFLYLQVICVYINNPRSSCRAVLSVTDPFASTFKSKLDSFPLNSKGA